MVNAPPLAVERLGRKAGKLVAGSRTFIARSGLGVSIRSGAKKPNIATVDAFKRALIASKEKTAARGAAV